MSASKKSTTKSTKSPAPATKPVAAKPAAPQPAAAKKTARQPSVEAARPAPAAVTAPPPAAAPAPKPAVKAVVAKPVLTTITARVDVGFGNALYIRGDGAGLSWDRGLPMECVGTDLWRVIIEESARGYQFKFLINDNVWSTGADFTTTAGVDVTLTPQF